MFNKKRKLNKFKRIRTTHGKSPTFKNKRTSKYQTTRNIKRLNPIKTKFKKLFILSIIIILICGLSYLTLFSKLFKISEITLSQENFENQTLGNEIKNTIKTAINKNIILINTEELELKILNTFPELEVVKINKNYPKTLKINFSQYPSVANVINQSTTIKKSYVINSIGYAIRENYENPNLPYIKMKTDEPANIENSIIEATKLNYMLETTTYFEDKFGMQITEIEYKKTAREIHLLTEKNFYIWLDIQNPYEEQLKKLKKALVKLDIYNVNLEYIDLRIAGNNGDKIIYKERQ